MKLNPRNSAQLEAEAGVQDEEEEEALIPKLSLSSLPRKPREQPPGTVTPPLYTTVSIPFQWEEAPGRPRSFCSIESEPPSVRCLELPPRLLNNAAKVASIASPTAVLDGPYIGRSLSSTWRFQIGGSFRSPVGGSTRSELKDKVPFFGSSRWASTPPKAESVDGEGVVDDPSSTIDRGDDGGGGRLFRHSAGSGTKVTTRTAKRGGSLLRLSHGKYHLWASICRSIKQAVPWRGRDKKTGDDYHPEMLG